MNYLHELGKEMDRLGLETAVLESGDYVLRKDGEFIAIINKKAIAKFELPKGDKPE